MTGVVGGSKFSRIYHTRDSTEAELGGWSLEEAHDYFTPSTGPYADGEYSVFDAIHDYGYEHGGWTSHKSLKALREHTEFSLSDEQRDEIVGHVNLTLAKELKLKKTILKSGQVVYRDRYGKFSRLVATTRKQRKIIAELENQGKIPESVWRNAQNRNE